MHLVQGLAAQQEQIAARTRQMLQTLAQMPEVQSIDTNACNRIFRNIHEQNPIYSTIAAAAPDGNMFAASAPFAPGSVNLADRKHIRDAIRTHDFSAGEHIVGKVSRVPSINFTYPVLDKNGKIIAILVAGLKLDKYKEFMTQVNLPKGSVMGIADHKNITLYRFPENENIPPGTPVPLQNLQEIPVDSREGFWEGIGRDNVFRIYAYKKVWLRDNEPWYLGIYVGVDKSLVLHHANTELIYNLAFLGIACLFAVLLAWIAGNSIIVDPLNKLVIATQRFGKGEMHTRTDLPHREDELGRLAKSFDTMAVMLEMEDLERRKAEDEL
ncbi:MAG: HAMP domain-containing protein, partial [Deltaproteobacteria bacterium]